MTSNLKLELINISESSLQNQIDEKIRIKKERENKIIENKNKFMDWIKKTYNENSITEDVLKREAAMGKKSIDIFRSLSYPRYTKIGTKEIYLDDQINFKQLKELDREIDKDLDKKSQNEMRTKACHEINKVFGKINKDNKWGLKIDSKCNHNYIKVNLGGYDGRRYTPVHESTVTAKW